MIVRKLRGNAISMPTRKIQILCLHELIIQTLRKYATYDQNWSTLQTEKPELALEFIRANADLLANPYSLTQEMLIKTIFSIINHPQYQQFLENNLGLFKNVIENLHTNLNYNTLLDCTVFKVPTSITKPKLKDQTTYYLIIQTKTITSDVRTIKKFSNIKCK